ncbi:hypothetical protein [Actinoplanes sp. RD1]|uniref:hypothetical protein n=1 Tax=Actinoplanes sp. RD1 TaxID=3064538 RepID=UPI0027410B8E|nr:hypothetical protein [Actinoplanes sp. RD1]
MSSRGGGAVVGAGEGAGRADGCVPRATGNGRLPDRVRTAIGAGPVVVTMGTGTAGPVLRYPVGSTNGRLALRGDSRPQAPISIAIAATVRAAPPAMIRV